MYESESTPAKIQQDYFNILQITQLPFVKRKLEELEIDESVSRTKVLEIKRMSGPEVKSKHIVIAISGFLTEDAEPDFEWQNLTNQYKHSECYGLVWNATAVKNFFDQGSLTENGRALTGFEKFIHALNLINTGKRQFIYAIEQAKVAGTLLAIFLIVSNVTKGRTVSLTGHSLGTVVEFNCMRVLKYFYRKGKHHAGRLLHNVDLWAGAFVLDPYKKYEERMQKAFHAGVCNGQLSNVWSSSDTVLKYVFA